MFNLMCCVLLQQSPLGSGPSQSRRTVEAAGVADQFLVHTGTELQGGKHNNIIITFDVLGVRLTISYSTV